MRFGKPSSTSGVLVAGVLAAAVVGAVGLALDRHWLAAAGLVAEAALAVALAASPVAEKRRHEQIQEGLTAQASFAEALVESLGRITSTLDADEIRERTRAEAERLFGAQANLLPPGETGPTSFARNAVLVPLRVRGGELGSLRLARSTPFTRVDVARATVLADFAARAIENAWLLDEANVREAEGARLSDQLITAEQNERRRLALFLHDTAVQSLSGIALMLDSVQYAIEEGKLDEAKRVLSSALHRHRATIGSLRDLSFNLEPVVLRDQGFRPAVEALAQQLGLERQLQIDVDVDAAKVLGERAQAALYQIVREALHAAIRRGPPSWISVRVVQNDNGAIETFIEDDAPGERRKTGFDEIAERARTISGTVDVEHGEDGGTTMRVSLPAYAARA